MGGLSERVGVADTAAVGVQDVVPPAPDPPAPELPPVPPPSPTQAAQDATVEQTGADPPPWAHDVESLALQLLSLRHTYVSLARRLHAAEEYIDTVSSPLYKRCWWWCCGYYFRKVGRWYPPDWKG